MRPPEADWTVDDAVVRTLLRRQLPHRADDRLRLVAEGFDAWVYRVGDDLAVRLPRRRQSAPGIRVEQRWLPVLGPGLPIPVPVPLLAGRAEPDVFANPWTVSAWIPGVQAASVPPSDDERRRLGSFLAALHRPAPADAPANPFRQASLAQRLPDLLARVPRLHERHRALHDVLDAAAQLVSRCAALPTEHGSWVHGDLHPFNLLVDDRRISGVIDWIDLTAGDPALDAQVVWWFWPGMQQEPFWEAYGQEHSRRERSRGWAVFFGLLFLDAGGEDPLWRTLGTRVLRHSVDG